MYYYYTNQYLQKKKKKITLAFTKLKLNIKMKKSIILLTLLLLSITSCTEMYDDISQLDSKEICICRYKEVIEDIVNTWNQPVTQYGMRGEIECKRADLYNTVTIINNYKHTVTLECE